jgi:hypothetical protein
MRETILRKGLDLDIVLEEGDLERIANEPLLSVIRNPLGKPIVTLMLSYQSAKRVNCVGIAGTVSNTNKLAEFVLDERAMSVLKNNRYVSQRKVGLRMSDNRYITVYAPGAYQKLTL